MRWSGCDAERGSSTATLSAERRGGRRQETSGIGARASQCWVVGDLESAWTLLERSGVLVLPIRPRCTSHSVISPVGAERTLADFGDTPQQSSSSATEVAPGQVSSSVVTEAQQQLMEDDAQPIRPHEEIENGEGHQAMRLLGTL